jgi:hypothetical protein
MDQERNTDRVNKGLQSRWVAAVPWIGLLIFLGNIFMAWRMASATSAYIRRPLLAEGGESAMVFTAMKNADLGQSMIYRRIIEGNIQMKAISNKQTTIIVGMAAGFGFLAVGFSLVIMAIRGSFELGATLPNKTGELVLRSSSPGILCFVLGAVVIVVALMQKSELDFRGMTLERTSKEAAGEKSEARAGSEKVDVPEPLSFDGLPNPDGGQ